MIIRCVKYLFFPVFSRHRVFMMWIKVSSVFIILNVTDYIRKTKKFLSAFKLLKYISVCSQGYQNCKISICRKMPYLLLRTSFSGSVSFSRKTRKPKLLHKLNIFNAVFNIVFTAFIDFQNSEYFTCNTVY
jgi:hypothetical protein